jgi:hypothetical protein
LLSAQFITQYDLSQQNLGFGVLAVGCDAKNVTSMTLDVPLGGDDMVYFDFVRELGCAMQR